MPVDESPRAGGEHLDGDTAALVALGEHVTDGARTHLQTCPVCQDEVAGFERLIRTARTPEQVEPRSLPAGTWDAVAAELGLTSASATVNPTPAAQTPRPRPSRRWAPVAAAAVLGVVLGGAGTWWVSGGPDSPAATPAPTPGPLQVTVASARLEPLPGAGTVQGQGTADVTEADGVRTLELLLHGIAPYDDGVLELWLLDADGGMVSLGLVTRDDLSVRLPADLDLGRFDVVDVSREPLDGDPAHSADSVVRGTLT